MTKLLELFRLRKAEGTIGIEIECEGQNLHPLDNEYWRTEADNSLRGEFPHESCEWLLKRPIAIGKVKQSLNSLLESQEKAEAKFNFSFRTSVHIHINVQDLTIDQIRNYIYAYLICENTLMGYVADDRLGNRFCLRMEDATGLMFTIGRMFKTEDEAWRVLNPNDRVRYSAMNIEAMWKYGSIEFRGMEGNLNPDRITNWTFAHYNIRQFAKLFNNVNEVYNFFIKVGPVEFFKQAVGEVSQEFITDKTHSDVARGFSLTIDLPFVYKQMVANRKKQAALNKEILNKAKFKWEIPPEDGLIREINQRMNINPPVLF